MALTQAEANALLEMAKAFVEAAPIEFSLTQPMDDERWLRSTDRRGEFALAEYRTRAYRVQAL